MSVRRFTVVALLLLCPPLFAEAPRVDRLGDPRPTGATMRLGSSWFRHEFGGFKAILSPEGKTLATVDRVCVHCWDVSTAAVEKRCQEHSWHLF